MQAVNSLEEDEELILRLLLLFWVRITELVLLRVRQSCYIPESTQK